MGVEENSTKNDMYWDCFSCGNRNNTGDRCYDCDRRKSDWPKTSTAQTPSADSALVDAQGICLAPDATPHGVTDVTPHGVTDVTPHGVTDVTPAGVTGGPTTTLTSGIALTATAGITRTSTGTTALGALTAPCGIRKPT